MSVLIAPIYGYDGYFVKSDGTIIGKKGRPLKPIMSQNQYCRVDLYQNHRHNLKLIHKLVAESFIPNPNNYPIVNHKDENPMNNDVSNLEWCTVEYNNAYGTKGVRTSLHQINRKDCSKQVVQFSLDGEYIATFASTKEAWRKTGINRAHISHACNHYRNQYTASGYRWAWESEVLKDGSYDLSCIFR